MSVLEPALFYLWHEGELVGMCTTHVDDILMMGYGKRYEASLKTLKSLVDFDQDEVLEFQHCGKTFEQRSDGTVEIGQKERAQNITQILVAPSRGRQRDAA
eukprot:3124928-Pyramimonas_sp.AAC.1